MLLRVGVVLIRVGLVLTCVGLVLIRVELCWYSCIRIDLITVFQLEQQLYPKKIHTTKSIIIDVLASSTGIYPLMSTKTEFSNVLFHNKPS